jgi:large subunit ribosomal protein L16
MYLHLVIKKIMFNPPQKQKYKKRHKLSIYGIEFKASKICNGEYGLKAEEGGYITSKQIEAARKAIIKQIKKVGKIFICIYPDLGVTNKPAETRMGKGKGNVSYWVAPVKRGKVIFEVSGISEEKAKEVLLLGSAKLPIKTRFI